MVQTHVVNTNRKKRNVLSRSKLLLQVLTLRENNKILAKAVTEKAMKICELENEGLSFKNIKLESRESIKSLRDYVLNLESMVKKAVSELAGVVNRFTSILSSTKIEKQNVEYLSNLINNDNPPLSPLFRTLRGKNIKIHDGRSKSQERKKHRPSIQRMHPMNLKKSVCVLEPLKETNDTPLETIFCEKNSNAEHGYTLVSIKSEESAIKKEVKDENASDTCSQEFNPPSTNLELSSKSSDMNSSTASVGTLRKEASNLKHISKSESVTTLDNSVKVIKKPRDLARTITSPRKLRPRKSINYAEMLNGRPPNSSSHSHHSRSVSDSEDKLGRRTPHENPMGKKSTRKCSTLLSPQQVKEELIPDTENFIDTESDFKCLEGLKIKHLQHVISKIHGTRAATNKHHSKRSSSNSSNARKCSDIISHNEDSLTHDSFKRILRILKVKKGHSRSDASYEINEREHGRQSSTFTLPQIGTEGSVSIKHEMISPKKLQ